MGKLTDSDNEERPAEDEWEPEKKTAPTSNKSIDKLDIS